MIAARAIGADETIIYVRTEYPLAVKRMQQAVKDAEQVGFLGENVFGSGRRLKCEVTEGAGAFVCGEETAMIASIEGQRGMPRPKPPFPAQSGLWGKPTIINNVETLAHVVRIIREGAENFRKLGTAASPGTKTFALTGHVANTGLIEVPFGTTLREVVCLTSAAALPAVTASWPRTDLRPSRSAGLRADASRASIWICPWITTRSGAPGRWSARAGWW